MASIAVANNMRELYRLVIVDTPLAPYFSQCSNQEDLDELNVEIMRNILYKAYLHDFMKFCEGVGGVTATSMMVTACSLFRLSISNNAHRTSWDLKQINGQ
uniref:Uncharacterized protein n=1 Tax=Micromonas pusilla TaxID=38833 RepID=A0A6U2DRY6_MICPS|mmetsp:Transcript_7085/g.27832  ORF Transcript_7085/g.27832 Transcript_7085/m.27832 type:complete len:101 (+) Transcript_7085:636-938(+)